MYMNELHNELPMDVSKTLQDTQDDYYEENYFPDLKGTHQGFIHTHHSSSIIKLPTVVRSRE